MSASRQYKWGALISYFTILVNIAQGLLLLPLMNLYLGTEQYGFYQLLGSLVGYVVLMDFGLGNAVIRYVAKFRAENRLGEMENFLGMVIKLYGGIGLGMLALGGIGLWILPGLLPASLPAYLSQMTRPMFALLVFNMTISMLCNIYPAVLNGFERFAVIRVISLVRMLVRTGMVLLALRFGGTALTIVLVDTIVNLVTTVLQMLLVRFHLRVRVRFGRLDRGLIREVFSYSFFIFLNMIMNELYWKVDTTIIGFINLSLVVVTTTGGHFPIYMMDFSNAISGLMLPKATQMVARGASPGELTDLMIRIGRIQLMVVGLLVVGFGFVGMEFLTLWMGATLGAAVGQSYLIALMLMLALVIPLAQCTAICIVQAMNRHAFRAVVLAGISVINVGVSIVLARLYGPVGAAVGTVCSLLIGNVGIINWYYHFRIGLDIPRFFRETFHRILPALLLISLGSCVTFLMPQGSLWTLLARGLVVLLLYGGIMYALGMNQSERALVGSGLQSVRRRRHR